MAAVCLCRMKCRHSTDVKPPVEPKPHPPSTTPTSSVTKQQASPVTNESRTLQLVCAKVNVTHCSNSMHNQCNTTRDLDLFLSEMPAKNELFFTKINCVRFAVYIQRCIGNKWQYMGLTEICRDGFLNNCVRWSNLCVSKAKNNV